MDLIVCDVILWMDLWFRLYSFQYDSVGISDVTMSASREVD